MVGTTRRRVEAGSGPGAQPFGKLARKIVVLLGEDVLAASNCRVLFAVTAAVAREVVVITNSPRGVDELGVQVLRTIHYDCRASLRNPALDGLAAWRLARILEEEDADAIHILGVKPAVLGALALKFVGEHRVIVHLPDLGWLEPDLLPRLYLPSPAWLLCSLLRRPSSFLLVETPQDLTFLRELGADPGARSAVIGGMGIDPDVYPVLPPSHSDMPIAAFAGRLAISCGLDILMGAFDRAWARGVRLQLELPSDAGASGDDAIAADQIAQWRLHPGVRRGGSAADMREVWRRAEICVLPAVTRQGVPHAVLEAAACGRALIVTDCAGGDNFVRHDIEGLVVPRGDAAALADAMEHLARDADLRARLGEAARLRVLQGFTESHVEQAIRATYASLFGRASPA
jgi:glycosyltransferase involved in cell wall biosynthesis